MEVIAASSRVRVRRGRANPCARKITYHELRNHAVEAAALVPVAFVGQAQLLEVLGSLRRDVGFEFHRDPTQLRGVAVAAELDVEVAHGVRGVHLEGGNVAHGLVDDLEDILGSGLAGTHGGAMKSDTIDRAFYPVKHQCHLAALATGQASAVLRLLFRCRGIISLLCAPSRVEGTAERFAGASAAPAPPKWVSRVSGASARAGGRASPLPRRAPPRARGGTTFHVVLGREPRLVRFHRSRDTMCSPLASPRRATLALPLTLASRLPPQETSAR